jgi:hypothetical protein
VGLTVIDMSWLRDLQLYLGPVMESEIGL